MFFYCTLSLLREQEDVLQTKLIAFTFNFSIQNFQLDLACGNVLLTIFIDVQIKSVNLKIIFLQQIKF